MAELVDPLRLRATSHRKASFPAKAERVTPNGKVGPAKVVGTAMPQRSNKFMWLVYPRRN